MEQAAAARVQLISKEQCTGPTEL